MIIPAAVRPTPISSDTFRPIALASQARLALRQVERFGNENKIKLAQQFIDGLHPHDRGALAVWFGQDAAKELASSLRDLKEKAERLIRDVQTNSLVPFQGDLESEDGDPDVRANILAILSEYFTSFEFGQIHGSEK